MANISKAERERRAAEAAAAQDAGADQAQEPKAEPLATTVPMVRGNEYPAPHAADVHPDEVANYAAGGWVVKE